MINNRMSDKEIFDILSKAVGITIQHGMVNFEMGDDEGDYAFYNDSDQDLYFYSNPHIRGTIRDGKKVMEGKKIRAIVEMVLFPEILPEPWPD